MVIVQSNFLTGLVGFLTQASLSLDRIPTDDLAQLREFYSTRSRHTPQEVIARIKALVPGDRAAALFAPNRGGVSMLAPMRRLRWFVLSALTWRAFGVLVLPDHLVSVAAALQRLLDLLAQPRVWRASEVHDVRIEIGYAASFLEAMVHPQWRRSALGKVYHLNHAQHLVVKQLEELAGDDWLKCGNEVNGKQ